MHHCRFPYSYHIAVAACHMMQLRQGLTCHFWREKNLDNVFLKRKILCSSHSFIIHIIYIVYLNVPKKYERSTHQLYPVSPATVVLKPLASDWGPAGRRLVASRPLSTATEATASELLSADGAATVAGNGRRLRHNTVGPLSVYLAHHSRSDTNERLMKKADIHIY